MSKKDASSLGKQVKKRKADCRNREQLKRAFNWALQDRVFSKARLHGNVSWSVRKLALLAVIFVWTESDTLKDAFLIASRVAKKLFGKLAVTTYQGLMKALVKYTDQIFPCIRLRLNSLMKEHGGKLWRIGKWLVLAVDGSRVAVPRTVSNEKAFSHKKKGKKKKKKKPSRKHKKKYNPQEQAPMMWLTLIWHVGLRLPWNWVIGPSDSSEREHFKQMLESEKYPENTMFCGDAGFVGYELWSLILESGHNFIIRAGANVKLLKKLGWTHREYNGLVYCWPNEVAKKKLPPIILRMVRLQSSYGTVTVLTNVLNQRALSENQIAKIYALRWGIEVQFRSFKQTFKRAKLRCRNADRARVELTWSLIGLWLIQLLAVKEQIQLGDPPNRTSVAEAVRAVRNAMMYPSAETLSLDLGLAVVDAYQRTTKKQSRNYPRRKDKPAAKAPTVTLATEEQREKAQQLKDLQNAA